MRTDLNNIVEIGGTPIEKLDPEQEHAVRLCEQWLRSDQQIFRLFGYAGTGKTTLAKYLVSRARGEWLFAAFTGKAAHVLRQKGCAGASTLHSILYRPNGESREQELAKLNRKREEIIAAKADRPLTENEQKEVDRLERAIKRLYEQDSNIGFTLWEGSPLADARVVGIVVDEASMVGERLGKHLESFGKKILVLGDPAQLPPVRTTGYLTNCKPDVLLTQVHRQARDSGILRLATHIREGGSLTAFKPCKDVRFIRKSDRPSVREAIMGADQVLCGVNRTRTAINKRYREVMGYDPEAPTPGDRIISLRNDHRIGVYNGSQWIAQEVWPDIEASIVSLRMRSEDEPRMAELDSWMHHLQGRGDELKYMGPSRRDLHEVDYGYAITVHKSQGSQWKNVVLFDESWAFRQIRRQLLYTGVTRASGSITIITE